MIILSNVMTRVAAANDDCPLVLTMYVLGCRVVGRVDESIPLERIQASNIWDVCFTTVTCGLNNVLVP